MKRVIRNRKRKSSRIKRTASSASLTSTATAPIPQNVIEKGLKAASRTAVIVTVMNEGNTLRAVLAQLNRLKCNEMIIVVNGTTDNSFEIAREQPDAIIVRYPDPLGYDVGRAIGAKLAQSDILLFLDGDIPIDALQLVPFIYEVDRGRDVVLNNITPFIGNFNTFDSVTILKVFLNHVLKRSDLRANSLTAIPHALSRRAVNMIGFDNLVVPPKALAKAVTSGLSVIAASSVNVVKANKKREKLNVGAHSPVADLIIGDHLEALEMIMAMRGTRLDYEDHIRSRSLLETSH